MVTAYPDTPCNRRLQKIIQLFSHGEVIHKFVFVHNFFNGFCFIFRDSIGVSQNYETFSVIKEYFFIGSTSFGASQVQRWFNHKHGIKCNTTSISSKKIWLITIKEVIWKTLHMIKSKFGSSVRSEDKTAQINEVL